MMTAPTTAPATQMRLFQSALNYASLLCFVALEAQGFSPSVAFRLTSVSISSPPPVAKRALTASTRRGSSGSGVSGTGLPKSISSSSITPRSSLKQTMGSVAKSAASRLGKLLPSSTVFFACDIQERFRNVIHNMPAVISTGRFMLDVSRELDVPCIVTEQYPKVDRPVQTLHGVLTADSMFHLIDGTLDLLSTKLFGVKRTKNESKREGRELLPLVTHKSLRSVTLDKSPTDQGALLHTVPELNVGDGEDQYKLPVFAKKLFSMCTEEVLEHLQNLPGKPTDVVLFGIEAHVCVTQTCLDLLERGYGVHIVCDGVSSQTTYERTVALQRLQQAGAFLSTAEQLTFQLTVSAEHPNFKKLSALVKKRKEEGNAFFEASAL